MSSNKPAAAAAGPSSATKPVAAKDQPQKQDLPGLGILEEDDEFEDFPVEDWNTADESKQEVHAWDDNWDDDETTDDFSNQLRAEFQKLGQEPMEQ